MFISEDLPAPFSPSRACTSPQRALKSASIRALKPSNDLQMPASWSAVFTKSQSFRSLLRDDALDEPVHLPEVRVGQHGALGDALLAVAVDQWAGVDLLAL